MNIRVGRVRKPVPDQPEEKKEFHWTNSRKCHSCKSDKVDFHLIENKKTIIRWCVNLQCIFSVNENDIKTWTKI